MAWTYKAEQLSTSPLYQVRFYLTDTDADDRLMEDEEVQFLLDTWMPLVNSVVMVAAVGAQQLANRFARELDVSGDGVSIESSALMERFRSVAASLRAQYKDELANSEFVYDFSGVLAPWDTTIPALWAGIGQHDNVEAGIQDGRSSGYVDPLLEYP